MEEIIKLAEEKGYKSSFMCTTPMKYSTKENIRQLILLVEIQKWLRDVYDVHVNPQKFFVSKEYYAVICYKSTNIPLYYRSNGEWHNMGDNVENLHRLTYEDALKTGIRKALEMIGGKTV